MKHCTTGVKKQKQKQKHQIRRPSCSHLQSGEVGGLRKGVLLLGGRVGPPLVREEPLRQDTCRFLVVPKDM